MNIFHQALYNLVGGWHFEIHGDDEYENIVKWYVDTHPTKQEVLDEVARLTAIEESNAYQKERAKNYPAIGDQLDMLWHAIDSGTLNKTSDFYTAIKAVKDANPKSE